MEKTFTSLSEALQQRVQEKQRAAKLRKKLKKEQAQVQAHAQAQAKARSNTEVADGTIAAAAGSGGGLPSSRVDAANTLAAGGPAEGAEDVHPASITQSEYFDACPAGLFRDTSLVASDANIEVRI